LPFDHFEHLVATFKANRGIKTLPAWAHMVRVAYAQLARRNGVTGNYLKHWVNVESPWLEICTKPMLTRWTCASLCTPRTCMLRGARAKGLCSASALGTDLVRTLQPQQLNVNKELRVGRDERLPNANL
jgi:hypothetical protein